MSAGMVPLDRQRLARVLGLLASNYDAEVCAAGRVARAMLQKAGMSWEEFIDPARAPATVETRIDVARAIMFCLEWPSKLSRSESDFLGLINRQKRPLTEGQIRTVFTIRDDVRQRIMAGVTG
jgi:hypothetical protein